MKKNTEDDQSMQIDLPLEIADGIYSNMVFLAHSRTEFILDFITALPGIPKAKVNSRIILAPEHAKRLLYALSDNINKYEAQNGEISLDVSESFLPPLDGKVGQA